MEKMYALKAPILTANYLKTLRKVCRLPPNCISGCVVASIFSHNFSTATERTYFDNLNEHKSQSPHGFGADDIQYSSGQGQDFQFGKIEVPNGVDKQDPAGRPGFLAANEGHIGASNSFRNEFKQSPIVRTGNFVSSGYNVDVRNSNNGYSEAKTNEFQGSSDRGNGNFPSRYNITEGHRNEFQNKAFMPNGGNNVNAQKRFVDSSNALPSSQLEETNQNHATPVATQSPSNASGSYAQSPPGLKGNFGGHGGGFSKGNVERNFQKYDAPITRSFQQMRGNYYEPKGQAQQPSFSRGSTVNDDSTEDSEEIELDGTIEELDRFLKEEDLETVVQVLDLLEKKGIPVDLSRYAALLNACDDDKSLEQARYIHRHLMRLIPNIDVSTFNRIIETYLRCSSVVDAFSVFDKIPRNFTSWDTMISGLVRNGYPQAAMELFTEFKDLGLVPDGEIYFGVFSACSALCDAMQGKMLFESMSKDYGIVPSMEHYLRMVDMLGSSGHTDEALEFIESMPIEPSVEIWVTLMNVSRLQGNLELGDRCAELIELLDPSRLDEQSRAGYIAVKASDLAKEKEKKKSNGQNPLEIRSRTHEFRAGDRSHPDHEALYELLRGLRHQMREAGYVAETKFVLHDIDQESKEDALLSHSERLAVAKGVRDTPARSTMRVIKNLRVCGDCHNAMKIVSKLIGRELIMRDAKRFHHFKDGVCSCRDYW